MKNISTLLKYPTFDVFHIFISKLCKIDKQKSDENVNFVFKVTNLNYNFFWSKLDHKYEEKGSLSAGLVIYTEVPTICM